MLTHSQFRKLLNNILMLPICRSTGVDIEKITNGATPGTFKVEMHFGAGHTNQWLLCSTPENNLLLLNMQSRSRSLLTYDPSTLMLDDASISLLRKRILPSQYTVGDIVATIINTADGLERRRNEAYNKVYMPISQCVDSMGDYDVDVVVNKKQSVPYRKMMLDADLSTPITDVKEMVIDIFGKNPNIKKAIPFFHIIISNGGMALYRYMFSNGKIQLSSIANRFDLSVANTVDKYDESQDTLHDLIMKAIEKWTIGKYDADSNGNAPKETIKANSRCALGFIAALQRNSLGVEYKPAQYNTAPAPGFIPGYGIDDYYSCYPVNQSTIHIYIQPSEKRDLCITYTSSTIRNIARLYVDVDKSNIINKNNLYDKRNVFIVSPDTKPIVEYNDGSNTYHTLTSFDTASSIDKAIKIVRSLVSIAAFMIDATKVVNFCTSYARHSERHVMDIMDAECVYDLYASEKIAPTGTIKISSKTNTTSIDLDCTVSTESDPMRLWYKIPSLPKYYPYTPTGNSSLFTECVAYITKNQTQTLGAWLTKSVAELFSVKLYVNGKGNVTNPTGNQQTKVYNATKFKSRSDMGNKLLDVRDAIINTFGLGIIGTSDRPSRLNRSEMNTSEFNYSINKVNIEGEVVPVLAEFGVYGRDGIYGSGGAFYAIKDGDTINVYCNFSDRWKKVTIVADPNHPGKYLLSDEFLNWYLLQCSNNPVADALWRAIEGNYDVGYKVVSKKWNPERQKIEVHKKLIYELDRRIKSIITGKDIEADAPDELVEYIDKEDAGYDPTTDVDKLLYGDRNVAADDFERLFEKNPSAEQQRFAERYHVAPDAERIPEDTDLVLHKVPDEYKNKYYSEH